MSSKKFIHTFINIISTIIVIAALSIVISFVWFPIIKIVDSAMSPTLSKGDIIVVKRTAVMPSRNTVIAFNYGSKLLVKRVVGVAGDSISINDGNIFVNGEPTSLPTFTRKYTRSVKFPYIVPDSRAFVVGDNTEISLDSRDDALGDVGEEQIVGTVIFRIWPLSAIGAVPNIGGGE